MEAMGIAIEDIDMKNHRVQHPRMGAIDVVPFIPIKNVTMDEAVELAKEVAEEAWQKNTVFQFSSMKKQLTNPREKIWLILERVNLKVWRKRLKLPEWKPDFGPASNTSNSWCTV